MSRLGKFGKMYQKKRKEKRKNQNIKLAQTKCQNLSMSRLEKFGKCTKKKEKKKEEKSGHQVSSN